jgi:hypothetical protein
MGWVVNIAPQLFTPWERDMAPIVQEAGRTPGPVWTVAESFAAWDLILAVVSCYTNCDFPAHLQLLAIVYQLELVGASALAPEAPQPLRLIVRWLALGKDVPCSETMSSVSTVLHRE